MAVRESEKQEYGVSRKSVKKSYQGSRELYCWYVKWNESWNLTLEFSILRVIGDVEQFQGSEWWGQNPD